MRLWSWADAESNGGFVARGTAAMIDALVRIKGFADVMIAVGWVTIDADGVRFPHWDRHNGSSAKERVMDQAKHWRNRHPQSGHDRDTDGTKSGQHRNKTRLDKTTQTTQDNGGVGGKRKADLLALDGLPATFHTEAFKAAWADWVGHRRDIGHPLTPRAVKMTFRELTDWGPQRGVAAIQHSIANGWRGLFEPKDTLKPGSVPPDVAIRRRQLIEAESASYLRQVHESDALVRAQRAAKAAKESQT
jgi:hypothetical protein